MNRSILIVDDEELIRKGIIARLEYLDLKPQNIYEAENGIQVFEILKNHGVDIVITDIRMPDIDGLDLIKQIKPLYPKIQFIIISGYAEFSYAEQAIKLGVKSYLLKPISSEALKKTMEEVLSNLEESEYLNKTIREGTRTIAENKRLLFEKSINDLLRNGEIHKDNNNDFDVVNNVFPIKNRWVMLGIINIDGDSYEHKQFGYKDIELIHFSIRNVFIELQSRCDKIIVNNLANSNQLFAMISADNKNQLRKEAERLFIQLQNLIWRYLSISLTIGVSSAREGSLNECITQAQEAFLQRMIHGNSNLYCYDDIKLLSVDNFPTSEINMLSQYIERHDVGNIEFMINEILSNERVKNSNATYIRIIWIRIVNILLKVSNTNFTKEPKNGEKLVLNFEVLDSFQSLEELRNYLYSLVLDCIQTDENMDINSKSKIKLAIKYITDNYNFDIAINDLSEKFSMSPNYFSTIFKRETGQTTVNFIKDIRIKKACEYLIHSDKSVVEISKEVGYDDSQYFFRVFKKATGHTPLEYRRIHSA